MYWLIGDVISYLSDMLWDVLRGLSLPLFFPFCTRYLSYIWIFPVGLHSGYQGPTSPCTKGSLPNYWRPSPSIHLVTSSSILIPPHTDGSCWIFTTSLIFPNSWVMYLSSILALKTYAGHPFTHEQALDLRQKQ